MATARAGVTLEMRPAPGQSTMLGRDSLPARMADALEDAGRELLPKIADAARSRLPHSGGLADLVAAIPAKITSSRQGDTVRVRLTHPAGRIDRGVVVHPVFGSGELVEQSVPAGFFSDPLRDAGEEAGREKLAEAARLHAARIT